MNADTTQGRRTSIDRSRWLMPFVVGAIVIAAITVGAIIVSRDKHHEDAALRLEAVAQLRADQVAQWMRQNEGQVQFGAESTIGDLVGKWLDAGDATIYERLITRLTSFHRSTSGRGVLVVDRQGQLIASVGKYSDFTAELADAAARAFQGNSLAFTNPYPGEEARGRYLDFAMPLTQSGQPPRAVLVLRIDANDYLLPTLARWPLPSRTAVSLLLDREGRPLLQPEAVQLAPGAALLDGGGAAVARDAGGEEVLAVARAVGATGWRVVAKIGLPEAYAEAHRGAGSIAGFGSLVLFAWGIALYLMSEREALRMKQAETREQARTIQALQLLQAIADGSTDAIYAKDNDGRFLLFNREASRAAGKPVEAVLGKVEHDIYPAEQADKMREADRRVREAGRPMTYENELDTVDGTIIYLTTKGPLRNPAGEVIGVYGISRDITARRRVETVLRESVQLVSAVGNSVLDHLAVLDRMGCVIKVNDAWRAFADGPHSQHCRGLPRSLVGANYGDELARIATPPAVQAREGIDDVLAGRRPFYTQEYCCDCQQDGQHWFVMKVTPLRTARGGVAVVHSDVSELKRATAELSRYRSQLEDLVDERTAQLEGSNRALIESERFVRTMTDNMPAALAYWDSDLRCRFANRLYRARYRLRRAAILEMDLREVIGRAAFHAMEPRVRNALRGQGCSYEVTHAMGDGAERHYLINLIPDQVDGTVRGFFVLGSDITELKQAQRQIEQANHDLMVARDRAEAASRAKSAFLANMSHEIRTPMNAILGFADLLKADTADAEAAQRLDNLTQAAQHLLALINDILDLSKIESGKFTLERTDFSLSDAVGRAVMLVADQARAKGLALDVDISDVPDALCGDPTRLSQALLNLLGNAVKFTERGRVGLRAGVIGQTDAGWRVLFEVCDTGIGIPSDKLGNLFGAFEQADSSTTRRFGGTGLGLALTRHLADLMDGETGVRSEPGRGSTFWFTASLARASASAPATAGLLVASPPAVVQGPAGAPVGSLPRAHVLVVEDNRFNQEVALAVLRRAGLEVDLAPDGQRAVERASAVRYDLVLMDLQMPVMDGFEATVALRGLPGYGQTPILALTANAFGETRAACLAAGMNDHIAKPITPQRLHEALARWLPRVAAPQPPRPAPVAATGLPAQLGGIEGFDPALGLELAGDEEAYLGLLRRFVAAHEDGVPGLDNCLATGQVEQARRLVHSLKGSAAAIGAEALREQAATCETAISRRDAAMQCRLVAFDLEYEVVHFVGALHDRLPPPAQAQPPLAQGMDSRKLAAALETLGYLLASGDFAAQRFHRDIAPHLGAAFGARAQALAQAVREHDYEHAFSLLETLGPGATPPEFTGEVP